MLFPWVFGDNVEDAVGQEANRFLIRTLKKSDWRRKIHDVIDRRHRNLGAAVHGENRSS
jgi:hypothetical protein